MDNKKLLTVIVKLILKMITNMDTFYIKKFNYITIETKTSNQLICI